MVDSDRCVEEGPGALLEEGMALTRDLGWE